MSLTFWLSFFAIVIGNVGYHIIAKSTPTAASPFLSLSVTYGVSFLICALLYLAIGQPSLSHDLGDLNWTSPAWGVALVVIEAGYIFLYRAGWKISIASLFLNVTVAILLVVIGVAFYKEHLSLREMAGIAFCLLGIFCLHD